MINYMYIFIRMWSKGFFQISYDIREIVIFKSFKNLFINFIVI